ncbi:hypothetical protein HDU76_007210 [Blyttiomyces sp. JEL0837]|nr:hypothetical protein HDU76_007210 [Blyttiomyces sp. JEL0837]
MNLIPKSIHFEVRTCAEILLQQKLLLETTIKAQDVSHLFCWEMLDVGSVPHEDNGFLVSFIKQLALQAVFQNPAYRASNVQAICSASYRRIRPRNRPPQGFGTLQLMGALKPKNGLDPRFILAGTVETLGLWQKPHRQMENLVLLRDAAPSLRTLTLEMRCYDEDPIFGSLLGLSSLVNLHTLRIESCSVMDFEENLQHCELPNLVHVEIEQTVNAAIFQTIARQCPLLQVFDAKIEVVAAADFCLQCEKVLNLGVLGFPRIKRLRFDYQLTNIADFILFAERLHRAFPNLASLQIYLNITCDRFGPQQFKRVFSTMEERSCYLLDVELLLEDVHIGNTGYTRTGFQYDFFRPIEEFFRPRGLNVRLNLES